jgi:hypothetical protein
MPLTETERKDMSKNKLKSLSEKRKASKFGEWKTSTYGSGKGTEVYWSWPKSKSKKKKS